MRFPSDVAHPFHRMPGQRRHGMARRAAQFAAVHARHGRLRGMDGRQALDAAERSRPQEGGEVGLVEGCRRRSHEPQPAARRSASTIVSSSMRRTAKRCGPSRAIRCGWSCPAGKATSALNGCGASKSATSPGSSREETSKYTDLMPDGKSRGFTWVHRRQIGHHFPVPGKAGPGSRPVRNPRARLERQRQDQAGRRVVPTAA